MIICVLIVACRIWPVKLFVKPIYSCRPFAFEFDIGQQNLVGRRARREERHEALDTLIGSLVIVILGPLYDIK
jgi:hypothetical protein